MLLGWIQLREENKLALANNRDYVIRHLDGWFKLKILVYGTSLKIFVDDKLVQHEDNFFRIPAGKVGFRNHGSESALVKNVRVTLLP